MEQCWTVSSCQNDRVAKNKITHRTSIILYLCNESTDPYADKHRVPIEPLEDVPLAMNLSSVDLIKECHHDERIEDNCEMLVGDMTARLLTAIVDVK